MNDYPEFILYQIKAWLGFYRPNALSAAHISLSMIGGMLLEHIQLYWGDFFLSYALSLTTVLWFLDTLFTTWSAIREGSFSPGLLVRACSKWLLWVSILFVAYSIVMLDPVLLGFVGKTMQTAVLLTQCLYVVRGAAKLLNNPLADQLVQIFEGTLERRIQALIVELSATRQQAIQAQAEAQQLRIITEDLQAHKIILEERLSQVEQREETSHE